MAAEFAAWGERRFGHFNTLGVWTLYKKEVLRFVKVLSQTVAAPVITSMLFLFIFTTALGSYRPDIEGIPFAAFMAPGLIMMQVIQNAFANTASSILVSKVQGNIVDVLMPPLSATEMTFAFGLAGATRGMFVALVAWLAMYFMAPLQVMHWDAVLFFAFGASLMLSFVGIIGGIWADKFDHLATVTNFIIMPAAFLSGTFYSVNMLPGIWNTISHWNPVFYLIDGFRYGFTGHADSNLYIGIAIIIGLNVVLALTCHQLFKSGYKLKA